jgi:hypothetical protein
MHVAIDWCPDVEGIEYAETYKKEEEKRLYKVKT